MAVKVFVPGLVQHEVVEDGTQIQIRDGHLEVLGRWDGASHETIAIYTPGNWRVAHVQPAK